MAPAYEFQSYNPDRPRMVTSFKGNQKLIFQGYRYNIHHIVPAKGVKTWRCVCAKKLTSARSWCKGRAETWDDDSQGTAKGEHNHEAEHDVAELEYFKSQLILAAIANPNTPLNDLIDEASSCMSHGVSFGSRDSLKKSLTVARKSAENGGFRLRCYKNSEAPKNVRTPPSSVKTNTPQKVSKGPLDTLNSFLSLVQMPKPDNNNEENEMQTSLSDQSGSSSSDFLSRYFAFQNKSIEAQDFLERLERNSPLAKLARLDDSSDQLFDDSGIQMTPPSLTANISRTSTPNSRRANANSRQQQRNQPNFSISGVDLSGVNSPSARSTPQSTTSGIVLCSTTPFQNQQPIQAFQQPAIVQAKSNIDNAMKKARANAFFDRLSSKAQDKAQEATRKSPDVSDSSSETSSAVLPPPRTMTIETQTDDDLLEKWASSILSSRRENDVTHKQFKKKDEDDVHEESNEEEEHECQNGKDGQKCGCRVVRVCCCENTESCRSRKRKLAEISQE